MACSFPRLDGHPTAAESIDHRDTISSRYRTTLAVDETTTTGPGSVEELLTVAQFDPQP